MAIVIVIENSNSETEETIFLGKIKLGRSSKADFQITIDSSISSIHCQIHQDKNERMIYEDLDSSNGSFLNDEKITKHELKFGEFIKLGRSKLYLDATRATAKEIIAVGKVLSKD